jgi:hypothetical protein
MKHLPFKSIYRENFEVVEQRQGRESRFPHDDQLPIIWRALDMEFRDGLPGRFARVDKRADGFHKVVRRHCALMYCMSVNGVRSDGVRLMSLPDQDLVGQVAVVQQVTRECRKGRTHEFRFYAGPNFQPEIRLSGKRVVFSTHALERFSTRVPNFVGADITHLLLAFYGTPVFSMPLGVGSALVVPYDKSLLAFTYKESPDEFFITTCLTVKELSILKFRLPPLVYNWHYGESFTLPQVRHWAPSNHVKEFMDAWNRKTPFDPPQAPGNRHDWKRWGAMMKDLLVRQGHGPGSEVCFLDNIPGPNVLESKPGQSPMAYDELAEYKRWKPEEEWDAVFAERDRFARGECLPNDFQP